MRITERQALLRLQAAIEAAGSQVAFGRTLPGLSGVAVQTAVSRGVRGTRPIHPEILAALGLRRDDHGDIHCI